MRSSWKGQRPAVVGAGLPELGVLADDLDHVGGGLRPGRCCPGDARPRSAAAVACARRATRGCAAPLRFARLAAAHRLVRGACCSASMACMVARARRRCFFSRPRRALVGLPVVAEAVERPDEQHHERRPSRRGRRAANSDPGLERRGVRAGGAAQRLDVRQLQPAQAERDDGRDARRATMTAGRDQRR